MSDLLALLPTTGRSVHTESTGPGNGMRLKVATSGGRDTISEFKIFVNFNYLFLSVVYWGGALGHGPFGLNFRLFCWATTW